MIIDGNHSVDIRQARWRTVFTFPVGTIVPKGRTNEWYKAITSAAGSVKERFGCYAWGDHAAIHYCGSFAQDYKRGFDTNLQGRVHQYLQNHRMKANGEKNTNLQVFEHINSALKETAVSLYLLEFETLRIDEETVDFATYTTDPELVRTVEQLLTCIYRRRGQCSWNRK